MKKHFMKRAPKEMTDEEVKEELMMMGVSTHKSSRKTKFSGFSAYAKEVTNRNTRRDYNAPQGVATADDIKDANQKAVNERLGINPYAQAQAGGAGNPYAQPAASSNPYASMGNPYGGNPYGGGSYDQPGQSSKPLPAQPPQPEASRYEGRDYSNSRSQAPSSNPYGNQSAPRGSGNPYGSQNASSNPYGSQASGNPYGSQNASQGYGSQPPSRNPYGGSSGGQNPYSSTPEVSNPYGGASYGGEDQFETGDTDQARAELFGGARTRSVMGRQGMGVNAPPPAPSAGARFAAEPVARRASMTTLDELNAAPDPGEPGEDEDELLQMPSTLNNDMPRSADQYAQIYEGEMNSEDEDVEEIKREIRFTKKETVQSTRNTLQMAAEAEAAGRNTLGMLGSQGERIANTETTLALAETQTQVADEQSRELMRLQRSIFIPNVSNPFNSKRRLQEKEAKLKSEHLQEQIMRERRRQVAFESEQRVLGGLNQPLVSETAAKYKSKQASEERRRLQFEEDSEDEAIEDEIDANLEGISEASTRLKNLSLSMNEEIESQNRRLDKITDTTDNLDLNVYISTKRLATIH